MMNSVLWEKTGMPGEVFCVVEGDLLKEPVDCIVNAANSHLAHDGGVAAVIARAAGPELIQESLALVKRNGPISTGSASITSAGRLPFKGVIHAVGPRWGEGNEEEKLVSALITSFTLAAGRSWSSLSFPAVSSGIFAVPPDICFRAYFRAVEKFFHEVQDSPLKIIRLCLIPGTFPDVIKKELDLIEKIWEPIGSRN